jgi:hypothetical protein
MYPAAARCRVADQAPHSKWHEESANALLDLAFLADDIHALVAKARARAAEPAAASFERFSGRMIAGWRASVRALVGLAEPVAAECDEL